MALAEQNGGLEKISIGFFSFSLGIVVVAASAVATVKTLEFQ